MPRIAAFLAATLLTGSLACAQTPPPPPPPAGFDIDRLTLLLDLNAEQKVAVQQIIEARRSKMHAAFDAAKAAGTRPDRDTMMAEHEKAKQDTETKLREVLNDLQMKKYLALTDMPPPRPPRAPRPPQD